MQIIQSNLLLIHLNINSIQNKFDDLKILNSELRSQIIVLSETKIDSTFKNEQFQLQGYNMYRRDRKKGGGGLMAFISHNIISTKLISPILKLIEVLALEIKVNNKTFLLIAAYRPPKVIGNDYYLKLENELSSLFMWAEQQRKSVILMGDLNLNRLDTNKREGKILLDIEESFDLKCLITKPTRITNVSSTLIDVLLTNTPELFKTSGTYNPEISDHCLIYGILNEKTAKYKPKTISTRSLKNIDVEGLIEGISAAPWHVGDIFVDIEDKIDYWNKLAEYNIDLHAPVKRKRVREVDVPYMTVEWKNAIRNKRKYAQLYAKNKTLENFELKKKFRNIASKIRRKAIKEYWCKKTQNLKEKPRDFFNTFRPFLGSKTKDNNTINLATDHGDIDYDASIIVNRLANYFNNVALEIGGKNVIDLQEKDHKEHTSIHSIKKEHQDDELDFKFQSINVKDTLDVLLKIKPKNAPGWNTPIPLSLLKNIAPALSASLTNIFNECIESGKWPLNWKKGEWTPAFKKGNKQDIKNYRPITVLPLLGKVFEQLVSRQITTYYDHIMHPRITAYRKRHSTETTLISLVEDWRKALDEKEKVHTVDVEMANLQVFLIVTGKEKVLVLSMDMSKAFDSLVPSLTLSKLSAYGFDNDAMQLMRSYFTDRFNRVKLDSTTSDWKEMKRGCPQGSSFGPMLWNLYQNDLAYQIKNTNLTMFADDHQMYRVGTDIQNIIHSLEKESSSALKWYKENYLVVNPDKFQFMKIGSSQDKEQSTLNIQNNLIEESKQIKLLGVTIDEHLCFSIHISELCSKASKRVGVLCRLKNLLPINAKLILYKSSILPYLTYCHTIWHHCRASYTRKVERIQERALRAIYNNHSEQYEQLLKKAKLPSLYNRRLQDIAILMYKVKHGLAP